MSYERTVKQFIAFGSSIGESCHPPVYSSFDVYQCRASYHIFQHFYSELLAQDKWQTRSDEKLSGLETPGRCPQFVAHSC